MDYAMISPRTCVLKVNFHCSGCQKKVYKALQKINGVRNIAIDGQNGKVTVSGSVDPYTLQRALAKIGKRAEILWDSSGTVNQHSTNQNRSISISQTQEIDPRHLQQLANVKGLKNVELTQTKTIKFTFNEDDDSCQDLDTCASHFFADDDHFNGQTIAAHHRLGGGSGPAISQGCFGHNSNNYNHRAMNNVNYHVDNGCRGPTRALPPPDSCDSHWRSGYAPSAPPALPPPRRMPPPPQHYGYYNNPSVFSDENPNGCRII